MQLLSKGTLAVVAALGVATAAALNAGSATAAGAGAPMLYANAQASSGARQYAANCAQCHGANLEGGAGPPLAGANMKTLGTKTHLTVGDMFQFMTSQMPMNAPASLNHAQYLQILAYILKQNGYPAGPKPLAYGTAMNSKVTMTSHKGG